MKIKTAELTGAALDWTAAIATGLKPEDIYVSRVGKDASLFRRLRDEDGNLNGKYMTGPDLLFSRKWEAAGPIIDREKIEVGPAAGAWRAVPDRSKYPNCDAPWHFGSTALEAAMICFVASKLGDEVEVPEELL